MPSSTFEYLVGTTWTPETNYIRMSITDDLYRPARLNITIADNNGETLNARQSVYTRYQKVRVIEGNSDRLIFYGKIERIIPSNQEGGFGQIVELSCVDNLNELLKQEMSTDGTYTGTPTTSEIISDIINGGTGTDFTAHAWTDVSTGVPNIGTSDTTKFVVSGTPLAADEGTKNLVGSSKNPLRVIEEFALADKRTTDTHLSGHDFFLDFEFDSLLSDKTNNTPRPDLNYHSRGTVPDTPETYGLTLEYQGDNTAPLIKSIYGNYSFPREASEIITKIRVDYVIAKDDGKQPLSVEVILIHHDAPSSGTFTVGNVITWGSGKSAIIKYVMPDNRGLLIATNGNDTWLAPISNLEFTETATSKTATVNTTTDSIPGNSTPPGSIREVIAQDIESVVTAYEVEELSETLNRASAVLYQGGDIVVRGNVSTFGWPYHIVTATHTGSSGASSLTVSGAEFLKNGIRVGDEVQNTTDGSTALITAVTTNNIAGTLVGGTDNDWDSGDTFEVYVMNRAGHSVYIKDMPPTDIANQRAIITGIEYTEGPGVQTANIELLLLATERGSGRPKNSLRNLSSHTADGTFQSPGAVGVSNISTLSWSFSGAVSSTSATQVFWTTGTLKLSDQRSFTIDAPGGGNTGTLSGVEYIYFDLDNPATFTSTPTLDDTNGINKILIAYGKNSAVGTQAEFFVYDGTPTPWLIGGANIVANSLTATEIANDSVTQALLKKGARSFASNLTIRGTAYNQISWDNGTASTDATITYGDSSTDTIADGTKTTGLADSTTYYAYITVTGGSPKTLNFSTNPADSISDDNLLLALIVIGVTTDGRAPTILPFNSKAPTISAIAIAADSITATHIVSETIGVGQLNFVPNTDTTSSIQSGTTKANVGLSNVDNVTAASIQAVAAATSGSIGSDATPVTLAGLKVAASTFFMGTGHFGLANTPFFVRGVDGTDGASHAGTAGDFSLGDKFIWDHSATTLTLDGTLTFGGGVCTVSNGGINFPSTATGSEVGGLQWQGAATTSTYTWLYRQGSADNLVLNASLFDATTAFRMLTWLGDVNFHPPKTYTTTLYLGDGTSSALALSRYSTATSSGTVGITGLYFYSSSAWEVIDFVVKGVALMNLATDGSSKALYMHAHIDMNNWTLYDAHEIRNGNGAYDDPSYTFDDATTSGLYYNNGVYITVGSATKFGASTTINYNYQKVYVSAMDSTSGGVAVMWEDGMLKQASSTERAKMNIRELEIDSSKIYDLETKSFEFRTPLRNETDHSVLDENGRLTYTDIPESTSFGLIAEAVNEVVPELVQFAANDGIPDGVDYPLLSVLLLTELKKLKSRIEVLEGN
jgi:hypothetical protein